MWVVANECKRISNNRFNINEEQDCKIFSYLVLAKNEPLNDRLSLPHKIFVAIDQI